MVVAGVIDPAALQLVLYPLTVPALPLLATLGILVGLIPAFAAPKPAAAPPARPTAAPTQVPRASVDATRGALR
jgi:energy-coupling factor transport system permease protein